MFRATLLCVFVCSATAAAAQPTASGKAFNPDLSANFLGLWRSGNAISSQRTESKHKGFSLQEAEIQMTSDVDPYLRASTLFSISQKDGSTDFGIDPEEVYVETLTLPHVTIKGGKFKMALGKHNLMHTHAFPFVDAPIINSTLLGDEGLNEPGVSAAVLLPTPWFMELTLQAFSLSNTTLFQSPRSGQAGGLGHFKNLWDLNDDLTLEWGMSGAQGKNSRDLHATIWGSDLTVKWRPSVGGKYHALWWSSEYLQAKRKGLTDATTGESLARLGGAFTSLQYQFAERWWVQGRFERVGLPHEPSIKVQNKMSGLVGFFPSEFSGFRAQYDHIKTVGKEKSDYAVALQYNVSIGAHPAHSY